MKHVLFPDVAAADAFIADLQGQGLATLDSGTATVNRRGTDALDTTIGASRNDATSPVAASPVAEEAGQGAVAGTGVGAVVGAAAGALTTAGVLGTAAATAATVATGGLALPVILGMAAAGAGVGAAVGAAGGAASAEGDGRGGYTSGYDLGSSEYDQLHEGVSAGGRAVAVDDSVPQAALEDAVIRHGGRMI